jgi:hypothetical protein
MVEKSVLGKATEVSLALPDGGFSKEVLSAVVQACSNYNEVTEGYLLLKKVEDDVCLLFAFTISRSESDSLIRDLMKDISSLFSEDIALEGACLNENAQLSETVKSITSPFYTG